MFSVLSAGVTNEIHMGAGLDGEFEGLNETLQHRISPVKHSFRQFHWAFRDAAPIGAVIVQRMREFNPPAAFQPVQFFLKFIHSSYLLIIWLDGLIILTSTENHNCFLGCDLFHLLFLIVWCDISSEPLQHLLIAADCCAGSRGQHVTSNWSGRTCLESQLAVICQ